jgi:hypothetical protein
VEDLGAGVDGGRVGGVDVITRLDRQCEVVEARRVQLERLRLECLPQSDRARARAWKAQVVDVLSALALDEERLLEPEWAEHRPVERERPLEVATHEVDMSDADEHDYLRMFTARATTITASERLIADCTSISIFAQRLSGSVSVGLKAAAFVNDT